MKPTVMVALLLGAAGCARCNNSRGETGRLLLVEGTTGNRGIYAHSLDKEKSSELVLGDSVDGVPFASGAGLLGTRNVAAEGDQIARLAPGAKTPEVLGCKLDFLSTVFAVDDAGKHVLVKKMERGLDRVRFLDTESCKSTDLDLRFSYRGDVAPDGSEAVIGGAPTTCTEKDVGRCPVTLYRLRAPGAAAPTEIVRGGPRAHYMPRYAGDRILFQTTERDAACDATINHCQHDIVSVPRAAGPDAPLQVVREGAVGVAVSASMDKGKTRIAFLSYLGPEVDCHKMLPCSAMTLKVGDLESSDHDVVVASGRVASIPPHAFSLDGRYIVFSAQVPPNKRVAEACKTDGSNCQSFGEMRILGWTK